MNTIKRTSFLTIILFLMGAGFLLAHGDHFHSLAELAEHIDEHVAHLEEKLSEGNMAAKEIKQECRELVEHAGQYQQLAQTLIRQNQDVAVAKTVETKSALLLEFARKKDLASSVNTLRQMQVLLQAF